MENIKKHIESYGFTTKEISDIKVNGYYCKNDDSKSEFILDFSKDNFTNIDDVSTRYTQLYKDAIKVVYLIQVDNNADEIMDFVEQKEFRDHTYLIYDKDDELEFFLKDLWNVLFSLQLMKQG
mgnify:CR=1 FL=1